MDVNVTLTGVRKLCALFYGVKSRTFHSVAYGSRSISRACVYSVCGRCLCATILGRTTGFVFTPPGPALAWLPSKDEDRTAPEDREKKTTLKRKD